MKLNLLPTYVSKASAAKTATIFSVLIGLLGVVGAVGLIMVSKQDRDKAYDDANALTSTYTRVDGESKKADAIIAQAAQLMINQGLAQAMIEHSTVYPDLYDEVRGYIPSFFRVTSMSSAPNGAESCTVTLTGVLQTQQQYADVMMALMRIPGATNVTRDGYNPTDKFVPSLTEEDQIGLPVGQGEGNIPSDPQARLDYMISQGSVTGFVGAGGFGGEPGQRGAMPDWSEITLTVTIAGKNLQTPDPRSTLTSSPGQGGGGTTPNIPTGGGRGEDL